MILELNWAIRTPILVTHSWTSLPPPSQTLEEGKEPFSDPTQPPVPSSSPFEAPFRDEPSRPPSPPAFDPSDEVQVQRQMMDGTHIYTVHSSPLF